MKLYSLVILSGLSILVAVTACSDRSDPVSPVLSTATPTVTGTFTVTSSPTPSVTSSQTATPTASPTSTCTSTATPSIYWHDASVGRSIYFSSGAITPVYPQDALINLLVDGAPISGGIAYLEGTNIVGAVTLTNYAPVTNLLGEIYSRYEATTGWTYQVGESYRLTTVIQGVTTVSPYLTAPGNISFMEDSSQALTWASWTSEGDSDRFKTFQWIYPQSVTILYDSGPDLDSPITIDPALSLPVTGYITQLLNVSNSTTLIQNAAPGSRFSVYEFYQRDVIR